MCLKPSVPFIVQDEVETLEGAFKALYELASLYVISLLAALCHTAPVFKTHSHVHTHAPTHRCTDPPTLLRWTCPILSYSFVFVCWFDFGYNLLLLFAVPLLLFLAVFLWPPFKTQSRQRISSRKWPNVLSVRLCVGAPVTVGVALLWPFSFCPVGMLVLVCSLAGLTVNSLRPQTSSFIHSLSHSFIHQVFECLLHVRHGSRYCFICVSRPCT